MPRSHLAFLALVILCSCGEAPEPPPTPPPPSVLVPQVGAGRTVWHAGWLPHRELVFVISESATLLWDPRADRIVDVRQHRRRLMIDANAQYSRVYYAFDVGESGLSFLDWHLTPGGVWEHAPVGVWERGSGLMRQQLGYGEARVAPTWDRTARFEQGTRRELVLEVAGRESARIPIERVELAYSPDGQRIATCSSTGVEVRASDTGAWIRAWSGDAHGCSYSPDGRFIAVIDRSDRATLLDATSMQSSGPPIEHVFSIVFSEDSARLAVHLLGDRPGLAVLDRASRTELAFEPTGFSATAIRGDFVSIGGEQGGLYSISEHRFVHRGEVAPESFRADGRSVRVVGDRVAIVRPDESEEARLDLPVLARLLDERTVDSHVPPGILAISDDRKWRVDQTLAPRLFGLCRPHGLWGYEIPDDMSGRAPGTVTADGRVSRILEGCIEHDDGTVVRGEFGSPRAISGDGTVFASFADDVVALRDVATATVRSTFVPTGERVRCGRWLELSHDGALVAVPQDGSLQLFDTATGRRVAEVAVDSCATDLVFTRDGTLLLHTTRDGARALRAVPSLDVLAQWTGPSFVLGGNLREWREHLVEIAGAALILRTRTGSELGRRADVISAGLGPREVAFLDRFLATTLNGQTQLFGPPTAEEAIPLVATLPGTLVTSGPGVLVTQGDEITTITSWGETGAPVSRTLAVPLDDLGPFARGVLLGRNAGTMVLVRARDLAMVSIGVVARGDSAEVIAWDGASVLAASESTFMLRRPELTRDGMIAAPRSSVSLRAWIDAAAE